MPHPQTHCKRGHEFTPENSLPQSKTANGTRKCRACQRERDRQYQLRRYHSMSPADRKASSRKIAKTALYKRVKRAKDKARASRQPIDLAFIDRVVREELDGTL